MATIIKQVFFQIIFWFFVFFVCRISFYFCITPLLSDVSFGLMFQSLYKGLRLDLSMIGYLTAFPFLLTLVFYFIQQKVIISIANFFNYLFIVIYILAAVGEACLYREWKAKLSMQALEHFLHPAEVFKSASLGLTILFFLLSILFSIVFIKIYNREFSLKQFLPLPSSSLLSKTWKGFLFLFFVAIFSALSIRGGLQEIPIQSSDAFFSTKPIANDAAVNPLWNIAYNIVDYENHFKENPYNDFEQSKAEAIVKNLYAVEKDTTIQFLTNKRPNIVFIIMESWSAYGIKSFGGDNFAPFIDSLSREGIRFTKLYPAGYVSDQGIPAVLSGYPSASRISVINQSSKSAKLPCINQDLKKYGYKSGFIFGGDLNYGNIKSYIYNKEFDLVKGESDFDASITRGKLGIQDEDMQQEFLKIANEAPQPFFYSWFALSSHMPYDFKGEKKQLTKMENEYINSISYSDKCFQHFFTEAKKQAWYKNTLFVIVADHSHGNQRDFSVYDPEYHRIPLLFFGNVIDKNFRGKNIENAFSQLDIVKTVLKQMSLDEEAKQYVWSKNMFNPYTKSFAYYCSFAGGGMVTNDGFIGYQHGLKDLIFNSQKENKKLTDSLTIISKAFQQAVYEDYRLK